MSAIGSPEQGKWRGFWRGTEDSFCKHSKAPFTLASSLSTHQEVVTLQLK